MAVEQPAYTGAQYGASYYKQPNETLSEYMMRLAQMRAKGVLGGGGMLDVKPTPEKEVAAAVPLGEVVVNQPLSSSDGDDGPRMNSTAEERYNNARFMLDNPLVASAVRSVIPMSLGSLLMSDKQLEGYVRNTQNEATGSQGFFDYLLGRDGDVVLGDRGIGTGSLVTGQATDITRSMFPEKFNPMDWTSSMSHAVPMPVLFESARVMPQAPQVDMTPLTSKTVTRHTDSGTGTDYTVQSSGSWNAADKSSWDTSGQGGKADGSYDISSWFSE